MLVLRGNPDIDRVLEHLAFWVHVVNVAYTEVGNAAIAS